MEYKPPQQPEAAASAQPVHERGPRMVTPLSRLGGQPADVDCPYCRRVAKTDVRRVSSDDSGYVLTAGDCLGFSERLTRENRLIQCLICLVCCPLLLCYRPDEHTNHHCSLCGRQLTHQPHGGQVTVVATPRREPVVVPSQFEQSGTSQP